MRLFIAINFNNETKNKIQQVQGRLKTVSQGNYSRRDNLHLTLAFLGEITEDKIPDIKEAMDSVTVPEMELVFSEVGCFRRDAELWWIGIKHNEELIKLQKDLSHELKQRGFHLESRRFIPHITIARETHIGRPANDFMSSKFSSGKINNIDLMVSERINGKLQYRKIHTATKENC